MKIGIISDTHDFLDPRIAKCFVDVDHILHAGDIGSPLILHELETIARVTAVGGNTDDPSHRYCDTQFIELGGWKFFLQHIVNPHGLDADLRSIIAQRRPDVILFGHTHKQFSERIGGVLFVNPGYAGKPRSNSPRSIAMLDLDAKEPCPGFIVL